MGTILWPLVNAVQILVGFLWTAFWITVALLVSLVTRGTEASLALARKVWAPGVLAICGVRLETRGLDRLPARGPLYVASNHQSNLDIPVLFAGLPYPLRFVAKRELAAIPFLGWYIRAMGMVILDRASRTSGLSSAERVATRLREGAVILSFPAGTRSRSGEVGRFKPGGFRAPIEAGAPVLPVAVWNAHRVMPAGSFSIRPGTIHLEIGSPIATAGLGPRDRSALARRVEEAVREMMEGMEGE